MRSPAHLNAFLVRRLERLSSDLEDAVRYARALEGQYVLLEKQYREYQLLRVSPKGMARSDPH